MIEPSTASQADQSTTGLAQSLGLFDSTMLVAGSMIGAGIFIVSADMARTVGSVGWLLGSWIITGLLTIAAALTYGELAGMMPRAGGQYVYLREAWSPMCGFLYGWPIGGRRDDRIADVGERARN
jgi:APA family basic amino acid/polyamine antiporter